MAKNMSRCVLSLRAAIITTLIVLGLTPWYTAEGGRKPFICEQSSSSAGTMGNRDLVVIAVDVKARTIQFGDKLELFVTLQNQGQEPVSIPAGALILKNHGWTGFPGGGSGLGESPLDRIGADGSEGIRLQSGESVVTWGSNPEMAAQSLGPMKADFVIEPKAENLELPIGKSARFSVSYYVAPSKLIASAWSARTAEQRLRLQPQMREVLLLGSKAEGWRDRLYVEGTLTYMGCYALPLLESAMRDPDPVVRERAVLSLAHISWAASELNAFIKSLIEKKEGRDWAASVGNCDENQALKETIRLEIAALGDANPRVRVAAIAGLTDRAALESNLRRSPAFSSSRESMDERTKMLYESVGLVNPAMPLVQRMAGDGDPGVRSAAQKFLSYFASSPEVAGGVAASLADPDATVRSHALQALKSSHEPPPLSTIEQAFASARGDVGLGLIELMYEREDSGLAARLSQAANERSAAERLMILTAISGHTDDAALKLVVNGLQDKDADVQRAALLRTLGFPNDQAISLLKTNAKGFSPKVLETAAAVEKELKSRVLFPFLGHGDGYPPEMDFPSVQGTGPRVSPDGRWLAYVETGWGRPGGTGGTGRSNLLSLVHVVGVDGHADHLVSDMFLVGWMFDSRRLASARDGMVAIVDLNGKLVAEFGDPMDKPDGGRGLRGETWPEGSVRHQFGVRMPHTKAFRFPAGDPRAMATFDRGEDAAFSPDGKWFGPRRVGDQWQFVDLEGHKMEIKAPVGLPFWGLRAVWSPDGSHIVVLPVTASNSFGRGSAIEPSHAFVIDFEARTTKGALDVDQVQTMGQWDYRKGRWNPWSKEGKHLTFARRGQIWISEPDGGNARQLTFDGSNKAFPTFSPNGTKIAYITWQFDNRERYTRLGPTDLWVVDCATGLAARLTRPDPGHIEGLDWLDNTTLIFDRLDSSERHSVLKTLSLK